MPLNLSPAFNGIPGIYVLGPARDGVHWKIGMASSLIDRLKSYAICFPRGFYIRMLVTLPPMEPGSAWMKPNIEQAVAVIERRIHRALDAEEKLFEQQEQEKKDGQRSHVDALDVYRMTEVHEQSEWFHGAFKDIKAVVARALLELGVGQRAKVHLNLASEKYGPAERGKESGRIPEGDTVKGVDASPLLLEHLLDSNEMAGVNAMFQLHQQSLDPKLQGLAIPDGPLEDRAYEVRAIKGKRVAADGTLEYKVAWKGYKREDWSWEPEAELENARQSIADWESHKAELRARAQQRKAARLERKQASQAARTLTRLPTVVTQRGTGYALKVGPIKRLPRQQGTRVRIDLKPAKKANFTVYQNIRVRIGADAYVYSEAWSLNSKGTRYDTFSVSPELRDHTYTSVAEMWIEPGGVDVSYQPGEVYDAETPWGLARGRWTLREPSEGTTVISRTTRLWWENDQLLEPEERRREETFVD